MVRYFLAILKRSLINPKSFVICKDTLDIKIKLLYILNYLICKDFWEEAEMYTDQEKLLRFDLKNVHFFSEIKSLEKVHSHHIK